MRNVSDTRCEEIENTCFNFGNYFRKLCSLWDKEEKYFKAGQATDENMAHAHCMLDKKDNRHELKIGNNYCSYSATFVARKRPNIASYVGCLSFLTSRHLLQVKET